MWHDNESPAECCRYYALEDYLFKEVHDRFHQDHSLGAFDLFSIVIWKANRAKSKIARKLLNLKQGADLETVARDFTSALFEAATNERRLLVAMKEWNLWLPMASAILSVLWPDEFTVYDFRVCGELNDFTALAYRAPENVWPGYQAYCDAVIKAVPELASLRDKDRCLWGRSAMRQLREDIRKKFANGT